MDETIKYPDFVTLPVYFPKGGKKEDGYIKSEVRLNPMFLYYYYKLSIEIDYVDIEVTFVGTAGTCFYIAMTYIEFDELWAEVKRGFDMKL